MNEHERDSRWASRRLLLRAGTLTSTAAVAGLAGCTSGRWDLGGGLEPENEPTGGETASPTDPATGKALMFADAYHPGARFRVVSPVIEETPDVGAVEEQNIWLGANTRIIEYLNTNERVMLFPVQQADIRQGAVYEISSRRMSVYDSNEGLVSVTYDAVPQGEIDERWADDRTTGGGGGSALVWLEAYRGDSLFRVTSDVLDWTPPEVVRETTTGTRYNTRYASYLNADDEFLLFPSESSEVERGTVYVMHQDFTIVNRNADLVRVRFERFDEGNGADGGNRTTDANRSDAGRHQP